MPPMGVGICEVTCPPPLLGTGVPKTTIGNTNVLGYCNVIAPQYIGSDMVCSLRTFIYPSTTCENVFDKIYYVANEQKKFQEIRVEFLITNGKRVHFKDSKVPTKVVLHFRKDYSCLLVIKHDVRDIFATFLLMHLLELYYRKQAGGGGVSDQGIGPIYSTPLYLQRGHRIGDFLEAYSAGFNP
jgi:hypothetical protein